MSKLFVRYMVAVFCVLLLTGCAGTSAGLFHGWQVQESIPLSSGEGTWETFDVKVQYQAQSSPETLNVAGQIMLTQHYHLLYTQVRRFSVYLFIVDDKGVILKTVYLLSTAFDSTEFVRNFNLSVALPEGADGFSFGYRGHVYEFDSSSHFDLLPQKPAY